MRFKNWKYPDIKEGKLTKYNWVVQHKDKLKLGVKTDIGAFTYIDAKKGVIIEAYVQIGSHCSIYSVSTIDNKEGKVIGEHRGIIFYTIGQRRGMGIADKNPLYVIAIDKKTNAITAGREEDLYTDELIAGNMNFINIEKLETPIKAEAKIRYMHQPSQATVIPLSKGKVKVKFDSPQRAVTPGQAVVFYNGEEVIGGGTIE